MNNTNHLVNSDNVGYASYLFEQEKNKGMLPGEVGFFPDNCKQKCCHREGMVGACCGPKQVLSNSEIRQQGKRRKRRTKMNTLVYLFSSSREEKLQRILLTFRTSNQWHLFRL